MRPGRGQSNKHGVSAVVIGGLSTVREPLRCFLIVSLRPSSLAFYSRSLVHRGERRKEEKDVEGRSRGIFNVPLTGLMQKGCGSQTVSGPFVFLVP